MPSLSIRSLVAAASAAVLTLAIAPLALAQSPPIKPGLWEVKAEREVNGQVMPMTSDRTKNLSPEARARLEAMMKQRGVATTGADGSHRVCLSKASLDRDAWQRQSNCKTEYGTRSNASWKWHSVCPESESDGEATFANSESYSIKVATTSKIRGETRTSHMTMNAKWVGSDCGTLKPIEPKP